MNTAKGMYVDGNPVYFKDDNVRNFISDEYSEDKTYAVGDYCINDNKLYMCTVPTSGGFDGSCWKQTNMSAEVSEQNKNLVEQSKKIGHTVYSTDEQIVGTWIDGRTIYRRSFYVENMTTITIDGCVKMLSMKGSAKRDGYTLCLGYCYTNDDRFCAYMEPNGKDITFGGNNLTDIYLIVEYLKE